MLTDMAGENKPGLVAIRDRRSYVIDALSEAFAHDALDMEEFEQRLTLAHRATTVAALDELVEDIKPLGDDEASTELAKTDQVEEEKPPANTGLVAYQPEKKKVVAIIGGAERKGAWRVPKQLNVVAVMGGIDLDFREVELPPGVTEVNITTVMGGVDIIVPPWIAVECEGWAIAGVFEGLDRAPSHRDPNESLLVIKGRAVMGAVDIKTRLPGESGWQAFRRRRRERKQLLERGQKRLEQAEQKKLSD